VCALCNASVNFILDHGGTNRFDFEPLQSPRAQSLLLRYRVNPPTIDGIVLIEDRRIHLRSTAALRICKDLNWPLAALAGLIVIPAPIRDIIYDWIAANRYRWFGKTDGPTCRIRSANP